MPLTGTITPEMASNLACGSNSMVSMETKAMNHFMTMQHCIKKTPFCHKVTGRRISLQNTPRDSPVKNTIEPKQRESKKILTNNAYCQGIHPHLQKNTK